MAVLLQNKLIMEYCLFHRDFIEEFLSFYDYYVLCNYPLSLLENKKDDLSKKNISMEKVNIP